MKTNIPFPTYQMGLLIEIQLMVAAQFGEIWCSCVVREREFKKKYRKNMFNLKWKSISKLGLGAIGGVVSGAFHK